MSYINFSSFDSIWYWLGLFFLWSFAVHRILGVPYYYWILAKRGDAELQYYIEQVLPENSRLFIKVFGSTSWVSFSASLSFLLTTWGVLAFYYDIEFLQAGFCLLVPMIGVVGLRLRLAKVILQNEYDFSGLFRQVFWYRLQTMGLAAVCMFAITFWGMYVNALRTGIFG